MTELWITECQSYFHKCIFQLDRFHIVWELRSYVGHLPESWRRIRRAPAEYEEIRTICGIASIDYGKELTHKNLTQTKASLVLTPFKGLGIIDFTSWGLGGITLHSRIGEEETHQTHFEAMSDEEVVELIRAGDLKALEYLLDKYKNFVRAKARSYFLIGADREDIIQEGMIGLYKSIRDYKEDKLTSFKAFAELCITRQIITAIKTATRQKHIPLNSYVSLDKPIYDEDSDRTLLDVLCGSKVTDPEEMIINQEEFMISK